jgi:hypothetical protein
MTYQRLAFIGLLVLLAAAPGAGSAQPVTTKRRDAVVSSCAYAECALSIAPTWNGLAVVRGTDGQRVANLNFFWPGDVSRAMVGGDAAAPGVDSAVARARRAVRIRRIGAALTDAGIVLAATAGVRALSAGRLRGADARLAAAGAASLGLGVPFQFAADGALSRAVWWHNLRYGR